MAAWQYPLYIIPQKSIRDRYEKIPEKLFIDEEGWKRFWENFNRDFDNITYDFEDAKTIRWWKNIKFDTEGTANYIDRLLTRADWGKSPDFMAWKGEPHSGDDHDCHISIHKETGEVQEFQFRIDLRNRDGAKRFMKKMLQLCSHHNFMLMDSDGWLFEPKTEWIMEKMEKSCAAKFLKDPSGFIKQMMDKEENKFQVPSRKKSPKGGRKS